MILVLLYAIGGFYLVLMAAGLLHRDYVSKMGFHRRLGLLILGGGFFLLGMNLTYYYFFQSRKSLEAPERYRRHYGDLKIDSENTKQSE